MPRHSAYRQNKDLDGGGPEWSYSQYVIGIAVLIVLCVTCFAVGYVVATYDRPLDPEKLAASETPAPRAPAAPAPAASEQSPSPTEPTPATTPKQPETGISRPPLNPTEITPLPTPGTAPTPMVKTPVSLPKPAGNEGAADIVPPTTTTPAPRPDPAPTPSVTPPAPKPATTPAATPASPPPPLPSVTPPAPSPPAPAPSVAIGSWGIQVAFFDGKDRKSQAETIKQRLKSNADQDATIVVSADGKEYRVVIAGFSDREAAKVACDKLKSKTGFDDAWIKRLP